MEPIGVFSPEQARELWQDYQSRKRLRPDLRRNYPMRRPVDEFSPHRVFVLNTEDEEIPPYACMRVIGVEDVNDRTAVKVEKPTDTAGEFLFNSQFAIPVAGTERATGVTETGVGWAFRFGVVVMTGAEPSAPNETYLPIVGEWDIEEGDGPFTVFGRYHVQDDALIGRIGNGGGGGGGEIIEWDSMLIDCPPGSGYWYVDYTAYSGGCGTPPGQIDDAYSDYDGLWEIRPPVCGSVGISEDTETGGAGMAVYVYPRDDCEEGFWRAIDYCIDGAC